MARTMSANQWAALLPARHEDDPPLISAKELGETIYGSVFSLVLIPVAWPGVRAIEDEADVAGQVMFQSGRWYVDEAGIGCLGAVYSIEQGQVKETDWLAHMLEKTWLYDPTDFFDALEFARKAAGVTDKRLDFLLWEDVRTAVERAELPFYPSRMLGEQHAYLVNRMDDQERAAFCQFLADQGIYPD